MFILSTRPDIIDELKDNIKTIQTEAGRYGELKKTYEAKRDHYVKILNDISTKN
jgi:hypothetical protein